jgi:hypothetical protein
LTSDTWLTIVAHCQHSSLTDICHSPLLLVDKAATLHHRTPLTTVIPPFLYNQGLQYIPPTHIWLTGTVTALHLNNLDIRVWQYNWSSVAHLRAYFFTRKRYQLTDRKLYQLQGVMAVLCGPRWSTMWLRVMAKYDASDRAKIVPVSIINIPPYPLVTCHHLRFSLASSMVE